MVASRLDSGAFTAADIQTMARTVDLPVEKVRRLTELAVFIAGLPRPERAVEPDGLPLDVPRLAAALFKRDYPRSTEPYHEWFAATGDRQYADEATVILGYLELPATMRPDWSAQWAAALGPSEDKP